VEARDLDWAWPPESKQDRLLFKDAIATLVASAIALGHIPSEEVPADADDKTEAKAGRKCMYLRGDITVKGLAI